MPERDPEGLFIIFTWTMENETMFPVNEFIVKVI